MLDGEPDVGRIFLQAHGAWFWGLDFDLSVERERKSYGDADSLD